MSTQIIPRYSTERGHSNHGWLKTFHTFDFATYQLSGHESFGSLRVINEDRVEPTTGFGTHNHREFEIFSYVVSGQLEHKDSMGNIEVLKRGDLQLTSAGTGIRHSEHSYGNEQVHFLQIWTLPWKKGLTPKYFTRHFADEEKKDKWVRVVAPTNADGVSDKREGSGPAPVQSPITLNATILSPSKSLSHTFLASPTNAAAKERKAYIHVVQTSGYNPAEAKGATIKVFAEGDSVDLKEGDGAYIHSEEGNVLNVENAGDKNAEILLFDVE